MKSSAVQFRGKKQVVQAYRRNDMAPWSIWPTARDMTFAYEGNNINEGADMLSQTLDELKEGGSEAAYTLKVYDDVRKGQKLTCATPFSRSFQFGLYEMEGDDTPYHKRQMSTVGILERRFNEMQDQYMGKLIKIMEEKEAEKEDPPETVGGIVGMLNGLLDTPGVKEALAGKILGLFGMGAPMIGQAPAQVAGMQEGARISPEEYKLLEEAISILAACDPKIGTHLLALAGIAKNNPAKYKMALNFL